MTAPLSKAIGCKKIVEGDTLHFIPDTVKDEGKHP
jgi:hypothetical protein